MTTTEPALAVSITSARIVGLSLVHRGVFGAVDLTAGATAVRTVAEFAGVELLVRPERDVPDRSVAGGDLGDDEISVRGEAEVHGIAVAQVSVRDAALLEMPPDHGDQDRVGAGVRHAITRDATALGIARCGQRCLALRVCIGTCVDRHMSLRRPANHEREIAVQQPWRWSWTRGFPVPDASCVGTGSGESA